MNSTREMTRQEWLEARRQGIGGSDAAAILGLSKWATPYSVWADKLGMSEERADTEAMRQGRDLEAYVAERFCEATGKKVRRRNQILTNDEYPWAIANIDRMVDGEKAGLECKTTRALSLKKYKDGEYPPYYYCQCMHYMAVTGAQRWYLAILVLGSDFQIFTIERDEAEIVALMKAEEEFWHYVETKEAPPVDGLAPTGQAIKAVYGDGGEGGLLDLAGREQLIAEYMGLNKSLEQLKERQDFIKHTLQTDLGEAAEGVAGSWKVSWKPQQRSTINKELLKSNYPQVDLAAISKTTTTRVFRISEMK